MKCGEYSHKAVRDKKVCLKCTLSRGFGCAIQLSFTAVWYKALRGPGGVPLYSNFLRKYTNAILANT
jgi:hypothetical protein